MKGPRCLGRNGVILFPLIGTRARPAGSGAFLPGNPRTRRKSGTSFLPLSHCDQDGQRQSLLSPVEPLAETRCCLKALRPRGHEAPVCHGTGPFPVVSVPGDGRVGPEFSLSRLPRRRPGRKGGEEGVGRTPPSSAEGAGRAGEGCGSSGEMKACGKPAGLCVEWTLASGSWTLRRWEERVTFSSCEVSLPHCAPKGGLFLIQTEAGSSLQRPDGGWPGLSSWAVGNAERKTGPRVAGMTRQERQP